MKMRKSRTESEKEKKKRININLTKNEIGHDNGMRIRKKGREKVDVRE